MKASELNNKSREELSGLLKDMKDKLLKLSFDLADNKVKDVSQIKKNKRNIARIMTAMKSLESSNSKS